MADWIAPLIWGLVAGLALVAGALLGYFAQLPARLVAALMAYGSGMLIAAFSVNMMEEAYRLGGYAASVGGFFAGALAFTLVNVALTRFGARHRKGSGHRTAKRPSKRYARKRDSGQGDAQQADTNALAIAIGSLLDNVPEAIVIGLSTIGGVGTATVAAVAMANLPEGLASAAQWRRAGRSAAFVFGVWSSIALATGLASLAGYLLVSGLSDGAIATTNAVAAGAILAMLADTMIPEAYEEVHSFSGFIMVAGFLTAFVLEKL